jgi:CheY-like chemotaxis protein
MADILLVDDNGNVLLTLAIALRRLGHIVTVSSDSKQALAHLQNHHFDFLVSDVRMPGLSGIELAAQVKMLPNPPRVILVSAYSNIEAREGLAEAYLRKPIDMRQLNDLLTSPPPSNSFTAGGGESSSGREQRVGRRTQAPRHRDYPSGAGHAFAS